MDKWIRKSNGVYEIRARQGYVLRVLQEERPKTLKNGKEITQKVWRGIILKLIEGIDSRSGYEIVWMIEGKTAKQIKFLVKEQAHKTFITVQNMMTNKDVQISILTPSSCDPSTETYWSM